MAKVKRRKRRTASPRTNSITKFVYRTKPKKRYRKNPSSSISRRLGGLGFKDAMKNVLPMVGGAMAVKFFVNKFSQGGSETEKWGWNNLGVCVLSGVLVAFGANAIWGSKRQFSQRILEGALFLAAYKLITTKLAPMNPTTQAWFGADEDINPALLGYGNAYQGYGAMLPQGDEIYVQGEDGEMRPINDSHRIPGYSGELVAPHPTLSGELVEPVPTMAGYGDSSSVTQNFQRAYSAMI